MKWYDEKVKNRYHSNFGEMVEKKSFPQSLADSCMNVCNKATADKSPIISYNLTFPIITYLCLYTLGV